MITAQESKPQLGPKAERKEVMGSKFCSLGILYDLCSLSFIAGLLFWGFLSLSGFVDIFFSYSMFYPHGSHFVLSFLGLFIPLFLLPSLHH